MKAIFKIMVLLSIMISCKDEVKEKPTEKEKAEEVKKIQRDTFSFDGEYEVNTNQVLKSELKLKLEKLADLENNYQVLTIRKSKFEESIVCGGIKMLPELSFERQYFEIKNLDKFQSGIGEINFAFIKGTKDLGSKTYARAQVEELIFHSEESAQKLAGFVNEIKGKGHTWEEVDKSPNSIFYEKDKVYYISSGGWYMKPFYQEIEKKMKK